MIAKIEPIERKLYISKEKFTWKQLKKLVLGFYGKEKINYFILHDCIITRCPKRIWTKRVKSGTYIFDLRIYKRCGFYNNYFR